MHGKKKSFIPILFIAFALSIISVRIQALDYPHNDANNIACDSCHYVYGYEPTLLPAWTNHIPVDIDDTQYNALCLYACHTGPPNAPFVKTHSSLTLDNGYGDWAVECRTCHNPHKQQFRSGTYGNEAYVLEGTVAGVSATTITAGGVNWNTNEYQGYIVVPNTAQNKYNYKILSNTSNMLTVKGVIDQTKVGPGNTFGISYGKLINEIVRLWKIINPDPARTDEKTVKFFNNEGASSFSDGDLTLDGICEVCHMRTNHFRYYDPVIGEPQYDRLHANMNYPAGTDCTYCHKHENGFIGMGDGAHSTHVVDNNGPKLVCADCHGTNLPPVLADGMDLANTTVCDNCHSSDGIVDAKTNWHEDPGTWVATLGEESFCGSCHDATPGNTQKDGMGDNAPNIAGNKLNYGFFVTGHGRPAESGRYKNLSWQEAGQLLTSDFGITDTNDDNPAGTSGDKYISAVQHTAGTSVVIMTINVSLISADIGADTVNPVLNEIYDAAGNSLVGSSPVIITDSDSAAPVITKIEGSVGSNLLTIYFNEPVYTTAGASGDIVAGDFTLVDSDNGRTITWFAHLAGESTARLRLSSALDSTNDIDTDTIAALGNEIYDASGNPMGTGGVTITDADTTPPEIVRVEGVTGSKQLKIIFSEPVYTTGSGIIQGNPAANRSCGDCHDLTVQHFNSTDTRLKSGFENDADNSNCKQCHYSGGLAYNDPEWYTTYTAYSGSAHGTAIGSLQCTDCHDVHGTAAGQSTSVQYPGMTKANQETLCYQCHKDPASGGVQNFAVTGFRGTHDGGDDSVGVLIDSSADYAGILVNVLSGWKVYNLTDGSSGTITNHNLTQITASLTGGADNDWDNGDVYHIAKIDDIQQAFSQASSHNLGTPFALGSVNYTLECVSCHNVHLVTGKHWDVKQGKSPVTRFADNTEVWGDGSGEKIQDFADRISNGYYQTPEGDHFSGTELPDYVIFCTDCHSQLVLGVVGADGTGHGINWGQPGTFGDYVTPDKHGLVISGLPKAGGCPDTYYCDKTNNYPRTNYNGWPDWPYAWPKYMAGRGYSNWSLMPYDTAERFAVVKNYVLSCTDCHEAHGSATARRMGRAITNGATGSINVMGSFCSNCHFMNGAHHNIPQGGCGNGSCHGSWAPTTNDSLHNMAHGGGSPGAGALYNYDLVLDMRFENNLNDSGTWHQHGQWAADGDGTGSFAASHDGGGNALLIETQPYTNPSTGNPTSGVGAFVEPGSTNGGWSTDGQHHADRFFSFKYSLSFEAWIYPTEYPALDNGDGYVWDTPDRYIISKATWGNYADYAMILQYIDNDYRLYFRGNVNGGSTGPSDNNGWRGAYSSVAIPLNQWSHVAVTYDASQYSEDHDANDLAKGRIRIYVNGEDVTTNQVPGTNYYYRTQPLDGEGEGANPDTGNGLNPCIDNGQCTWRMVIGSKPYAKSLVHFIGKIDDVKMWNVTKNAAYFDSQVPPVISSVEGISGDNKLYVTFSESAYSNTDGTGDLDTGDFVLTDVSGNGALAITGVTHTAGDTTAVLTLSGDLAVEDIDTDTLEPAGSSIYDEYGDLASFTDPVAITAKVNAPTLDMVRGDDGHDRIVIRFSEAVYANSDGTGTLQPSDFTYSDASGNSIVSVDHTLDNLFAALVLDGDVNGAADIGVASLTPVAGSIFDITGNPVNISPVTLDQGQVSSISSGEGVAGSNVLKVTFGSQVYSAVNESGALDTGDFAYSNVSGDGAASITGVTHSAGSPVAFVTLNTALIANDIGNDTIAANVDSIFGPGAVSFPLDTTTAVISAQTAPSITRVEGASGFDKLFVAFSEGVYTGTGRSGALTAADFADSDAVWDISGVQHVAGQANAILTLTSNLDAGDIGVETISAANSTAIYNNIDNPAATGSVTIDGYDCPTWGSTFDFSEGTGSSSVTDDTTLLAGTVGNPSFSMNGDGLYTGDETEAAATYIDIDGAGYDKCLQTGRAYTIETRFFAGDVDKDYVDNNANNLDDDYDVYNTPNDQDGDGRSGTYSRIMERQGSYQVTLMRAGYGLDYMSKRAGKARLQIKYRRDNASLHTCPHPQWPEDDTWTGNSAGQHQINSDIEQWPIIDNHWYRIRVVFNSDKVNIAGSDGTPVDIFVDDQGETGLDDATEQWSGYINVSDTINNSGSCRWGALPGDYTRIGDYFTTIGDDIDHTDIPDDRQNFMLKGKLDWISWKPYADYSGVPAPK